MKKSVFGVFMGFLLVVSVGILPAGAYTVDIDLNDFYLDGIGSIAPDGSSATLEVDSGPWGDLLQNDPFNYPDPGISVPAGALLLSFGYDFFEEAGNDTEFYVRLFDGLTGNFIDDFALYDSAAGMHSFVIASLSTNLLGLEFMLNEYIDIGSIVTISNLQLAGTDQTPIPEPGTLLLLSVGGIALGCLRRKRRQ